MFFTTHVLDVVERLCDEVAIIDRGRIVAQGTLDEIRAAARGGARRQPGGRVPQAGRGRRASGRTCRGSADRARAPALASWSCARCSTRASAASGLALAVPFLFLFAGLGAMVAYAGVRSLAHADAEMVAPLLSAVATGLGVFWIALARCSPASRWPRRTTSRGSLHFPIPLPTLALSSLIANLAQPTVLAEVPIAFAIAAALADAGTFPLALAGRAVDPSVLPGRVAGRGPGPARAHPQPPPARRGPLPRAGPGLHAEPGADADPGRRPAAGGGRARTRRPARGRLRALAVRVGRAGGGPRRAGRPGALRGLAGRAVARHRGGRRGLGPADQAHLPGRAEAGHRRGARGHAGAHVAAGRHRRAAGEGPAGRLA